PEAPEHAVADAVRGSRQTGGREQGIRRLLPARGGGEVLVGFVPRLVSMSRGLLATLNLRLTQALTTQDALHLLREYYRGEPFVRVVGEDRLPQTKAVLRSEERRVGRGGPGAMS